MTSRRPCEPAPPERLQQETKTSVRQQKDSFKISLSSILNVEIVILESKLKLRMLRFQQILFSQSRALVTIYSNLFPHKVTSTAPKSPALAPHKHLEKKLNTTTK